MSGSIELKTVEKCTPQLETALKGLGRELVHSLCAEGFINTVTRDNILRPETMLTPEQKAGKLVGDIKDRIKLHPPSYR